MFNCIRWIYRRVHVIILLFVESFFEVVKSISADEGEWIIFTPIHIQINAKTRVYAAHVCIRNAFYQLFLSNDVEM